MKKTKLVQIKRRKIEARQFSQVDEGKVFLKTKRGRDKPKDGDWLIEDVDGTIIFVDKYAMEYLTTKDEE